jgi:hypothetical protein
MKIYRKVTARATSKKTIQSITGKFKINHEPLDSYSNSLEIPLQHGLKAKNKQKLNHAKTIFPIFETFNKIFLSIKASFL